MFIIHIHFYNKVLYIDKIFIIVLIQLLMESYENPIIIISIGISITYRYLTDSIPLRSASLRP